MSDPIHHECGIAFVRLLKPLSYYQEKYGTAFYGLNKLYLLMEKQHNRGQDGAGIATIKLGSPPGSKYIDRVRSTDAQPLKQIFDLVFSKADSVQRENKTLFSDTEWLKKNVLFAGEVLMGHLRYATHGSKIMEYCHPVYRANNWITRNLLMAGNFNLTNTDELFELLIDLGQHPKEKSDTVTILEKFGHFLDMNVEDLFAKFHNFFLERHLKSLTRASIGFYHPNFIIISINEIKGSTTVRLAPGINRGENDAILEFLNSL